MTGISGTITLVGGDTATAPGTIIPVVDVIVADGIWLHTKVELPQDLRITITNNTSFVWENFDDYDSAWHNALKGSVSIIGTNIKLTITDIYVGSQWTHEEPAFTSGLTEFFEVFTTEINGTINGVSSGSKITIMGEISFIKQ
ncbi:hypothetical protein AGMMS50230_09440 [Spirochaetia bacterium]|nr:hypothetical protein AGMMS50230_09440 [Spirochaetia bacterium]